jgi:FkbM family methyltransferase
MYYGQNKEDFIFDEYIKKNYGENYKGTILEIGANDGVTLSNSRYFIENGWFGFLIEPARKPFQKLILNKLNESICYNIAIGVEDKKLKFFESGSHISLDESGLLSSLVEKETIRWRNRGVFFEEYDVDCLTWVSFTKKYNLENQIFDIISIDVEGLDYEILTQIDLDKVACKILCVEFNGKRKEDYVNYLAKFNMVLVHTNGENLIFLKQVESPHNFMKTVLNDCGYTTSNINYGEKYYTDDIFKCFEKKESTPTPKSHTFEERFKEIISDPNNLFIERTEDAGKVIDDKILLHNGIELYADYYGNFIDVFKYNLGVHEPSEERAFQKVLSVLPDSSKMVELGSYWCMYSIWFMKTIKNSQSFCIEPDLENFNLGVRNFELNKLNGDLTQGSVGKGGIDLLKFFEDKQLTEIDILHSDIQGNEYYMLNEIKPWIENKKIKYFFVSTHSDDLHYSCISLLQDNGYKILCSCDFNSQTYQHDGFILACPKNLMEIEPFNIGNRSKSILITDEEYNKLIQSL